MTIHSGPGRDEEGVTREAFRPMPHPGFQFEEAEDRRVLVVSGLRLIFSKAGARWSHALAIGDGREPVAASFEGDPHRDSPTRVVSPAYQEIQPHDVEGGARWLLTGQSSPHHFSAVVTVRAIEDAIAIEFDVADRCRAPIEALAATYQLPLGPGALIDASSERIVWQANAWGKLEFSAGPGTSFALAEAGRQATRVQALARLVPTAFTHRLIYHWRWSPPDPSPIPGADTWIS